VKSYLAFAITVFAASPASAQEEPARAEKAYLRCGLAHALDEPPGNERKAVAMMMLYTCAHEFHAYMSECDATGAYKLRHGSRRDRAVCRPIRAQIAALLAVSEAASRDGNRVSSSVIGYARVSTTHQDLDIQIAALKAAGCGVIRSEKVSGSSTTGRTELRNLLDFIRKGDTLVVTRIDRLARSIADLATIVRELEGKGAALKATEQPIDTSTAAGRAFLQMLGVFAEFETAIRKERQMEGITAAKAAGVYKGRPPSIKPDDVAALKAKGLGATEIAKRLKIGRASVYRVLEGA
jgi:DNA invertase Pin-like site-specific DNA recombinase